MKSTASLSKISDTENSHRSPKSRHVLKHNEMQECKPSAEWSKVPLRESNKVIKPKISTVTPKINTKILDSPAYKCSYANRKSVEESTSSLKSNYPPLNTSHPPLNKFLNPSGATSNVAFKGTPKSYSKLPSTPVTPKGGLRTPRNTPIDYEKGSLQNTFKGRVSIEEKNTPVATNTPLRKSVGNSRRYDARKSSSLRKSSSQNLGSYDGSHLTPINLNQRLPSHWPLVDSHSKKGEIQTPCIVYDFDRRDDESDSSSSLVTVGVRIRPISERESHDANIYSIISMSGNEVVVRSENGTIHTYSYDYCFDSSNKRDLKYASQKSVYECMAKPLLSHVFEGYNVCLFAYGQTGSGKSYCIMGEDDGNGCLLDSGFADNDGDNTGIMPRFCRDLFSEAQLIHSRNADKSAQSRVVIEISYIEIYNEKIYDLIGSHNSTGTEDYQKLSSDKREALKVREHPRNGPYVIGASCHLVSSYEDLQTWISLGNKQRSIAATGMNDKSSRSHSVFSITVTQTETELIQGEEMEHSRISKINLVDLAGSERVAASNSEGDRLKEGVCINKSLLTLGKVITALAESTEKKKTFIPYRESTLTWLLKESLGGNSKTSMIATISPCNIHQEESLSTLRYAQQARKIVNWNRINEDPTSKIIRALKLEVERLRSMQVCYSPRNFSEDFEGDAEEGTEPLEIRTLNEPHTEEQRSKEKEIILLKEAEIKLLKEKLRSTQEQFSEKAKLLEDKVQEAEKSKQEALERCRLRGLALKVEDNQPTLVNLCEDPQLSQTLLYNLKKGSTTLGTSNADVTLSGLHETDIHCSILYEGDRLILHPKPNTETYVNGKLVTLPIQIFHNDRIVLAGTCFFRVSFPSENTPNIKRNENKVDYLFARDELLKEQEERIRHELNIQQASARADMLRELEEQRQELKLQEIFMKDNVQILSDELDEERNFKQEAEIEKMLLEEEKQLLESQINCFKRLNSQGSDSCSQSSSPNQEDCFFKNIEMIFSESVRTVETSKPEIEKENVENWFLVAEANSICSKLKKPYHFQQQSVLKDNGFEILVIVHDLDHNLCAWLDLSQLKKVLTILRDITLNEGDDNTLLETSIPWEREDKTSRMPVIQNKIRENVKRLSINHTLNTSIGSCLNLSFNSNIFSGVPGNISGRKNNKRKSLLNQSFHKLVPYVSSSASIAKAVSKVLLNEIATDEEYNSVFINIIEDLLKFYNLLKRFINHFREYPAGEDSELLDQEIVNIAVTASNLNKSLSRLSLQPMPSVTGKALDVKINIKTFGSKIIRKAARMLQGVEKEVETLVEEENESLLNLIYELLEEIGFLNLASYQLLPEGTSLISSLQFCRSFLIGVSKGLEWSVEKTAEASHTAISCLLISVEDSSQKSLREQIISYTHDAFERVSNFLDQFSLLKVIPCIEPTMSEKEAKKEVNSFLIRVSRASKNTEELISSFVNISQQIRDIYEGSNNISPLNKSISKLQENLGELVDDAGLRSSGKKLSISSINSEESFLDELYTLARTAFKNIDKLKSILSKYSELELHPVNNGLPIKSCLKTNEFKKVRFDVSLSSTLAGSFLDDQDDEEETVNV